MTESPTVVHDADGTPASGQAARALGPIAFGLAVTFGLLAIYLAWEAAFGHLGALAAHPLGSSEMPSQRIALTLIALTGFLTGAHAYARRALVRDVEDLGPALQVAPHEHAALVREAAGPALGRGSLPASLVALGIGLLVVTGREPGVPYLLGDTPWGHDYVWGLALNALLFALLGRIAVRTLRAQQLFARIETRLAPVSLLRRRALQPFTRHGLRTAFLWIGGSSIASIVFVDQRFAWPTGLVLLVTVAIGTLAFLLPMRGLHGRLRAAKEAELERVRREIERARAGLLEGQAGADALRMPGLLAYERRIADVSEWPLDAPQLARFALVLVLGVGSWIGAALIERLVDAAW